MPCAAGRVGVSTSSATGSGPPGADRSASSPRSFALAGIAVVLAALAISASAPRPPGNEFWFWIAACLAGELMWVRLPLGRVTLSMASACNFAALLLLPRAEAMLAAAAASLVAELCFMRKPPARALFNAGQTVLAVGGGSVVYHALSNPGAMSAATILAAGLLPLAAAAAAYALANTGAVSVAVGLTEAIAPWRAWWRNFGSLYELLSTSALFSLGTLIAVLYSLAGPLGTALVSLPLLLVHDSYRRYLRREGEPGEREEAQRAA